jgi:hypothetical protein
MCIRASDQSYQSNLYDFSYDLVIEHCGQTECKLIRDMNTKVSDFVIRYYELGFIEGYQAASGVDMNDMGREELIEKAKAEKELALKKEAT